jgi:hypothetical protein
MSRFGAGCRKRIRSQTVGSAGADVLVAAEAQTVMCVGWLVYAAGLSKMSV